MSKEPGIANIQDRYAENIAADLESNAKEQESIRSQMASWQSRLDRLEEERAWLAGMLGKLAEGSTALEQLAESRNSAAGEAEAAAPKAVPQQRQAGKATSESGGSRRNTAQTKPRGAAKTAKTARTTKPVEKAQAGAKKDEPTLRELILEVLTQHYEPRMAREVAAEVKQTHPGRNPSDQVVRNGLNSLIAKGAVEREEKQNSVFYTAVKKEDGSKALPEPEPEPVEA
ncbi:hypothetical protein [Streptomyces sp. SYSU K217416]